MELTRVDFTPSKLNAAAFPDRADWLLDVKYVGGHDTSGNYLGADSNGNPLPGGQWPKSFAKVGGKTVQVHQLCYRVQGISEQRWRRCFVAHTYVDNDMKPILLVSLPSSSPVGFDGARQLFQPQSPNVEFSWPLEVVRDNGIFAVMVDRAAYGWNSYAPTNPYDQIIDDVSAIDAARWFIDNTPIYHCYASTTALRLPLLKNLLIGGLSYGAITSGFLAGVLKDAECVYMAGAYVNKSQQIGNPQFYPSEWDAQSWDFSDMWKASRVKKMLISFGQGDYARQNPSWTVESVDNTCNGLSSFSPNRFAWRVNPNPPVVQGHEIDIGHIRTWFASQVTAMTVGERAFDCSPW